MSNLDLQVSILHLPPMFCIGAQIVIIKYKPMKILYDMKRPDNGPLSFWREPAHASLRY